MIPNEEWYRKARIKLVDEYVSRWLENRAVIEAMKVVPRHQFVPRDVQSQAYEDYALYIGYGQTISQPSLVAMMTQMLKPNKQMKVLEIGTGSGYQAAVLAELAGQVITIERIPELANFAKDNLIKAGYSRVRVICADGIEGYLQEAPYDGILVTASAVQAPPFLKEQLIVGGRLVIPLKDENGNEYVYLGRKLTDGKIKMQKMMAVKFVPLVSNKVD